MLTKHVSLGPSIAVSERRDSRESWLRRTVVARGRNLCPASALYSPALDMLFPLFGSREERLDHREAVLD